MAIVQLSKEIIQQILLRLPVKSLLRFESVSKDWKSLISSSEFVKAHLKNSTKNKEYNKLIFGSKNIPSDLHTCSLKSLIDGVLVSHRVEFNCPSTLPGGTLKFLGSSNGLVSVLVRPNTIVVWNPTTRKSTLFPRRRNTSFSVPHSKMLSWGFGYDQIHNDYKVVQLFSDTHLQVYSLRTHSWKRISSNQTRRLDTISQDNGKLIHGGLHWTAYMSRYKRWVVCSYYLATETYVETRMPELESEKYYDLEVLGGYISITSTYGVYLDVWLMMEFGKNDSWTRVYRIPFSNVSMFHRSSDYRPHPLFLLGNKRMILHYGSTLRICDWRKPDPQQLGNRYVFNAITYVESLVSPMTWWMNES